MRGIAVLLVVMYHCGIPGFDGGFIGVDVFFALSGYLITGLILNEIARTGKLSFRNFYARRARRLLPAAGLVILTTLLLALLVYSPLELAGFAKWAAYTSLYFSNYMFVRDASNYFASDVATNPFLHTWSLAIEEQFYLLWPALIATSLLLMKSRRRLAVLLALISAVSLALCIWLTHYRQPWAFFSLPPRAWEFGLGGLACMLPAEKLGRQARWIKAARLGRVDCSSGGWLSLLAADKIPGDCGVAPSRGHARNLDFRNNAVRKVHLRIVGRPICFGGAARQPHIAVPRKTFLLLVSLALADSPDGLRALPRSHLARQTDRSRGSAPAGPDDVSCFGKTRPSSVLSSSPAPSSPWDWFC